MTLKNPDPQRLAQELAELRHVSIEEAVTDALRESLERERRISELLEIGKRCSEHISRPAHSSDHAKLYDNQGL